MDKLKEERRNMTDARTSRQAEKRKDNQNVGRVTERIKSGRKTRKVEVKRINRYTDERRNKTDARTLRQGGQRIEN